MPFDLVIPFSFEKKLKKLPSSIKNAAKKTLIFLSDNPRHPSLKIHKVNRARGHFGGNVYEAYVTQKYRITWEYGPDSGAITLRNIDNHDECLKQA